MEKYNKKIEVEDKQIKLHELATALDNKHIIYKVDDSGVYVTEDNYKKAQDICLILEEDKKCNV